MVSTNVPFAKNIYWWAKGDKSHNAELLQIIKVTYPAETSVLFPG